MTGGATAPAGFCGKLPTRADFVVRRVPLAQVERWHTWLAEMIAVTRDVLGDEWLNAYLYGPIWRFALPAGIVGPDPIAGTLMPSVDAVGRYFPLTIMVPLPPSASVPSAVLVGYSWFDDAEALSLAALEGEIDIDALNDRLGALSQLVVESATTSAGPGPVLSRPGSMFAVASEEAEKALLDQHVSTQLSRGNSVWWTRGSERIPHALVLASGLPAPASFAAMFSGEWAKYGWQEENLADSCGLITSETTIDE